MRGEKPAQKKFDAYSKGGQGLQANGRSFSLMELQQSANNLEVVSWIDMV
jgi:hypothetical protein